MKILFLLISSVCSIKSFAHDNSSSMTYLYKMEIKNLIVKDNVDSPIKRIAEAIKEEKIDTCVDLSDTGSYMRNDLLVRGGISLLTNKRADASALDAIKEGICKDSGACSVSIEEKEYYTADLKFKILLERHAKKSPRDNGERTYQLYNTDVLPKTSIACEIGSDEWSNAFNTSEAKDFLANVVGLVPSNVERISLIDFYGNRVHAFGSIDN